jgi:hypothetical protein
MKTDIASAFWRTAARASTRLTDRRRPQLESMRPILIALGQIDDETGIPTKLNKWLAISCILLGGLGAFLGVTLIVMYVWAAVISRIGEPDQSLLFWYLPIMFLGMAAAGGGIWLLVFGLKARKGCRK